MLQNIQPYILNDKASIAQEVMKGKNEFKKKLSTKKALKGKIYISDVDNFSILA